MPSSRNRRRAQSQAQLSGRRRNRGGRRQRGSSVSQQSRRRTAPEATAANGPDQAAVQTAVQATPEAPATTPAPETASVIRRRPTRARTPAEPLQMYPYLRSELTRIGVLTALIAVALGVLTFVLG